MSEQGGLAKGALGTFESAVMGIAGTAPAFSVAVTTGAIVAAVGVLSVGSIFYCDLIMFGIMLAFFHLSKISPHAGAAYAWVGHVFGRKWGFFAGWGLLVASIFFMVSATIPAATSTLVLLAPERVEDTVWVTGTAAVWLTLVTLVVTKGIKHASYAQMLLTGMETAVVLALIGGAFIEYGGNPAHTPSLIWFSPFSFTPQLFATGALTAIFFYWAWDVTMNLSEETREGHTGQPGRLLGDGQSDPVLHHHDDRGAHRVERRRHRPGQHQCAVRHHQQAIPGAVELSGGAVDHPEHHRHHRDADPAIQPQHVRHGARRDAASALFADTPGMADAVGGGGILVGFIPPLLGGGRQAGGAKG